MIYQILKPLIRLAIALFCPQLEMRNKSLVAMKGPVLITANHPDSFLDAIIIATLFDQPIHFLARGDAFHKPWHNLLLRTLHMFPVYRLSEGKEYLGLNAAAFENSRKVLSQNGIVLIFIEGICLNKHELQPFKKGAARIASTCWKEGIPLKVLPLGISYSSFDRMGKSVLVQTGSLLEQKDLMPYTEEAKNYVRFNQVLFEQIKGLIEAPIFRANSAPLNRFMGKIGATLHRPLYTLLRNFVKQKTRNTVFYDSVLFGLLFFSYPLYLLLLGLLLWAFSMPIITIGIILLMHPILAYFACSTKMHSSR